MELGADKLWLIPLLPLLSALVLAFVRRNRLLASVCSIGSLSGAVVLSVFAFATTINNPGTRLTWNFAWTPIGEDAIRLGFILDPLTAVMLVMVTIISLLIFIYSTSYMAADENYVRFFCFLSLFAAGMLGVVIANSLLLLFICWEIVGLASYLLIGFWYFKPTAAAAAKKAFITTRIGDLGLFIGMLWLYSETGTLLFYDGSRGVLEQGALNQLAATSLSIGIPVVTGIALLIFCGAMGKSGQFPLHVWLPDAMEGPTPVSALIHAATMVAAGVFLIARVYPLVDADPAHLPLQSTTLTFITWIGAITALFGALVAVAQNDIKRILAYSTISQLGYMMIGLGVGGVAVGMFHLLTHAFFKALLFLGAGSIIHGSHEEQDITRMRGLRKVMPITFCTYAIGMMALSGFPLFFSGFWSKDEILHAAAHWHPSKIPFLLGLLGAFLTAFYMTRQMAFVFFGKSRASHPAHESPRVMTTPLVILAAFSILLGFLGTPAWPWLESYLSGHGAEFTPAKLFSLPVLRMMVLSTIVVAVGVLAGWFLYGRRTLSSDPLRDPLVEAQPALITTLRNKFYLDELYSRSIISLTVLAGRTSASIERGFFFSVARVTNLIVLAVSWANRLLDTFVLDKGFDESCRGFQKSGWFLRLSQGGFSQNYLRAMAVGAVILMIVLAWRVGE